MGKVKLSIEVEDGKGTYRADWNKPTNVDISVAISQLEILKQEMIYKLSKSEVKWNGKDSD
ncbi:MAG: hypothetical protein IIA87_04705 [Nanoarchaeota archaeon]|nr:hypothetical protein [Nanoarchaeota archaeon]